MMRFTRLDTSRAAGVNARDYTICLSGGAATGTASNIVNLTVEFLNPCAGEKKKHRRLHKIVGIPRVDLPPVTRGGM